MEMGRKYKEVGELLLIEYWLRECAFVNNHVHKLDRFYQTAERSLLSSEFTLVSDTWVTCSIDIAP